MTATDAGPVPVGDPDWLDLGACEALGRWPLWDDPCDPETSGPAVPPPRHAPEAPAASQGVATEA